MRIVFLNFWARNMGGAEHSLVDIITRATMSHETFLITTENGALTEKTSKIGGTCIVVPCKADMSTFQRNRLFISALFHLRSLFTFFHYCRKIKDCIDSIQPDCIHSNVPKSHIILFFMILTGFNKRSIFHIREIFNRYSWFYFIYMLLFNSRKSTVIAISNAVKQSLPLRLQKNTTIIYNGVCIPPEHALRQQLPVPPRFLYLGRVVPWKGCDLLIDAFILLYNKYDFRAGTLTITGGTFYWDIAYRNTLNKKINASGFDQFIHLNEHITDISHVFLSHSVFCLPSYQEPFGRVAAEAMAHGLPVLGFRSGGLPEVVEHTTTGLLAETRSAFSLFEIMEQCVLFPDRVFQMGVNGRKRCNACFNKDSQMERVTSFISGTSGSSV